MKEKFWSTKTLAEMDHTEWEALCDGCALCCLHKIEDEETQEVLYTRVACQQLDIHKCQCKNYQQRTQLVKDCLHISLDNEKIFSWLPKSCAYRCLHENRPLPKWHPLRTGRKKSVHQAEMSIQHLAISENDINMDELEDYVIYITGEN